MCLDLYHLHNNPSLLFEEHCTKTFYLLLIIGEMSWCNVLLRAGSDINFIFCYNKHNQKPTGMFNKQDLTVYLRYIKILKDLNILNFRLHIPEAIFIALKMASGM